MFFSRSDRCASFSHGSPAERRQGNFTGLKVECYSAYNRELINANRAKATAMKAVIQPATRAARGRMAYMASWRVAAYTRLMATISGKANQISAMANRGKRRANNTGSILRQWEQARSVRRRPGG